MAQEFQRIHDTFLALFPAYEKLPDGDELKFRIRYHLYQLLDAEEKLLELEVPDDTSSNDENEEGTEPEEEAGHEEEKPKKEKQKREWSPEARAAASLRMKNMQRKNRGLPPLTADDLEPPELVDISELGSDYAPPR